MGIQIKNLSKYYNEKIILENVNLSFDDSSIYCLMGTSGAGKTTLLHILAGLVRADGGLITGNEAVRFGMVFQEERLCETYSAIRNVMLVLPKTADRDQIEAKMSEILPAEALNKPVKELSGGMRRRVSVCRAVLSESDVLIMDEPFTGLDENTKAQVVQFVLRYRNERMLLLSTHNISDVAALNGTIISLK